MKSNTASCAMVRQMETSIELSYHMKKGTVSDSLAQLSHAFPNLRTFLLCAERAPILGGIQPPFKILITDDMQANIENNDALNNYINLLPDDMKATIKNDDELDAYINAAKERNEHDPAAARAEITSPLNDLPEGRDAPPWNSPSMLLFGWHKLGLSLLTLEHSDFRSLSDGEKGAWAWTISLILEALRTNSTVDVQLKMNVTLFLSISPYALDGRVSHQVSYLHNIGSCA